MACITASCLKDSMRITRELTMIYSTADLYRFLSIITILLTNFHNIEFK